MDPNRFQQMIDLHVQLFLKADPETIRYWSEASRTSLTVCGLALISLFALLALRKTEGTKMRFLEIPVAGLLALSCLGWLVSTVACDTIAESLLIGSKLGLGDPGSNGVENIRVVYMVNMLASSVAAYALLAAIGFSGFLRNFLLGISTLLSSVIAVIVINTVSYLPFILFT